MRDINLNIKVCNLLIFRKNLLFKPIDFSLSSGRLLLSHLFKQLNILISDLNNLLMILVFNGLFNSLLLDQLLL